MLQLLVFKWLWRILFTIIILLGSVVCYSQAEMPNPASGFWKVKGNAGMSSAVNFLGTTTNVSLRVRTNNIERMVIDSIGNVGIGIAQPLQRLHVAGSTNGVRIGGLATGGSFLSAPTASTDKMMYATSLGDLRAIPNGTNGQVLQIVSGSPQWSSNLDDFCATATVNYVPKFTSTTQICNSIIFDNGTNVGISTNAPTQKLHVEGSIRFSGPLRPNNLTGNAGQVLTSVGAGGPPVWTNTTDFSPWITSVSGTASLTASSLSYVLVPGLSATITVPAGTTHTVLIQTDGGVQLNDPNGGAAGFTDIAIFVDGAQAGSGRRVPTLNSGSIGYSVDSYSFSHLTTLGAGNHTIQVRAKKFSSTFSTAIVSSPAGGSALSGNPPLQGILNIIQFP